MMPLNRESRRPTTSALSGRSAAKYLIVGLIFSIFSSIIIAKLVERRVPLAFRIYDTIIRESLLSKSYIESVEYAVKAFSKNTRYQYGASINTPPDGKNLTFILFDYIDKLPKQLQNTCTSFPKHVVIYCDSRLISTLPSSLPIMVDKEDSQSPSFLLMWIIGHEIGHVVLAHDRKKPLYQKPFIQSSLHTSKPTLAQMIDIGDQYEKEADDFVIKQLSLNPSTGVQASALISDTAMSLDRLYKSQSQHDKTVLNIHETGHPPMLVRLASLSDQMSKKFIDYREIHKIKDLVDKYEVRRTNRRTKGDDQSIFNIYNYSYNKSPISSDEVDDIGLYTLFTKGASIFSDYKDARCSGYKGKNVTEVSSFCESATGEEITEVCNKDESESKIKCAKLQVSKIIPCLLTVQTNLKKNECDIESIYRTYEALQKLDGVTSESRWIRWVSYAEIELAIRLASMGKLDRTRLAEFISNLNEKFGPGYALWGATKFMQLFRSHSMPDSDLANLRAVARDASGDLSQYDLATQHGEAVIEILDRLTKGNLHPGQSYHRVKLARIQLSILQNILPHTSLDSLQENYMPRIMSQLREGLVVREKIYQKFERIYAKTKAVNSLENEPKFGVGEEFLDLPINDFLKGVPDNSLSQTKSDDTSADNLKTKERLLKQLNIAANDIVYFLNNANFCLEATSFVPVAFSTFDGAIGQELKASTLENAAAAHVCAEAGNASSAHTMAAWAVQIRTNIYINSKTNNNAERLVVALFTLWSASERVGDDISCSDAARSLNMIYNSITRKNFDSSSGTMVAGQFRKIERCLKLGEQGADNVEK